MEISELKDLIIEDLALIDKINGKIRERNKAALKAKKYQRQGFREIEMLYADRMHQLDSDINKLKGEERSNNRTIEYELYQLRSLDDKLEMIDTLMDLIDKAKAERK